MVLMARAADPMFPGWLGSHKMKRTRRDCRGVCMKIWLSESKESNCSKRRPFSQRERGSFPPRPQDFPAGFFFLRVSRVAVTPAMMMTPIPVAVRSEMGSSKEIHPMSEAKMMAEN